MITRLFIFFLIGSVNEIFAQSLSKSVIDYCSPNIPNSCGPSGRCIIKKTGNRCECGRGFMGKGCARPCQDIYKSCENWKVEERCSWTRPISPFFTDNCALSCGLCQGNGKKLHIPLPPILEPIAWFVGRWESKTSSRERFPEFMSGAYKEILEVQVSEVPMFDRPPVNISVRAETLDGQDVHRDVGFMTGKPFKEDTGFVEFDKPTEGDDQVAIEMTSNTGLITIEEGIVKGNTIRLQTTYKKNILGDWKCFRSAIRLFTLLAPDLLEERTVYTDYSGKTSKWLKRYRRIFDYLHDLKDVEHV